MLSIYRNLVLLLLLFNIFAVKLVEIVMHAIDENKLDQSFRRHKDCDRIIKTVICSTVYYYVSILFLGKNQLFEHKKCSKIFA